MALHNSNVLALLNSYNAGKIAENSSRQALAAEESAAANRYIAGQLDQSLQLQQRQAEMQHMMLESAAKQNRQLNALRQELSEVGFAIEGLGSDIRAQTDLHRQHYDEVKKEKKLKEVLYNFEKYLDACDRENDKVSAAYGSKKTAEMITATGFTTADLSDKADKKDYDALVERANAAWASLSDTEKEELASIEKMYFSYRELKSVNVAQMIDAAAPLLPQAIMAIPNAPESPSFKHPELHPILKKSPELLHREPEIRDMHARQKRLVAGAVGAAIVAIVSFFVAVSDTGLHLIFLKLIGALACIAAGITVMLIMKISSLSHRYSAPLVQLVWALSEHQSALQKAHERHRIEMTAYETKIAALGDQHKAEASRIKSQNEEIEAKNAVIRSKRSEIENQHILVLDDLKSRVNIFLDKHKGIQEFLPKLS